MKTAIAGRNTCEMYNLLNNTIRVAVPAESKAGQVADSTLRDTRYSAPVMAKLHERTVIEEIDEDPARFDGDLEKVLIGHSDSAEDFLKTVFGFIDRKTRYFKQKDVARKVAKLAEAMSPSSSSGKGVKGGFFGKVQETESASKVCKTSADTACLLCATLTITLQAE